MLYNTWLSVYEQLSIIVKEIIRLTLNCWKRNITKKKCSKKNITRTTQTLKPSKTNFSIILLITLYVEKKKMLLFTRTQV